MLDTHTAVPLVKLFEEIGIHLQEVQRRRIRKGGCFHETKKQKKIIQLGRLLTQIMLVATERYAVHEFAQACPKRPEFVGPIHRVIISRDVYS